MSTAAAETQMNVGVQLRTQVVDENYAESELVRTGGALLAEATNLGIISFEVKMATRVIGASVTDYRHSDNWDAMLLLPASSGAKTEDQADTKLLVVESQKKVAFRTVGLVRQLGSEVSWQDSTNHYESDPLDVFASTY